MKCVHCEHPQRFHFDGGETGCRVSSCACPGFYPFDPPFEGKVEGTQGRLLKFEIPDGYRATIEIRPWETLPIVVPEGQRAVVRDLATDREQTFEAGEIIEWRTDDADAG